MRISIASLLALLLLVARAPGAGVDLTLHLPDGMNVASCTARNREMKLDATGFIQGRTITFKNLLPDTPYDVCLTLADGTVLQGVDMSWYDLEPARKDAGDLTDDDRDAIRAVLKDIKGFTNKNDVIALQGDHSRAVLLAQLVRDTDFHARSGDEVIWRIELWYFKFNYGGWEKVAQVNKVLRRERFKSQQAYHEATDKIKWMPSLGGLRLPAGQKTAAVDVAPPEQKPAK